MGHGTSCLSKGLVHHYSSEEDHAELIRVVRSTDGEIFEYPGPVLVKDLMSGFQGFSVFTNLCNKPLHPDTQLTFNKIYHLKPLLIKPCIKLQADVKPIQHIIMDGSQIGYQSLPEEETSVLTTKRTAIYGEPKHMSTSHVGYNLLPEEERSVLKKPNVLVENLRVKKVRFADQLIVPSSDKERISSSRTDAKEELSQKKVQSTEVMRASYAVHVVEEEDQVPHKKQGRKGDGGVMRLKMMISKKQLTELMSPTTTEKEADALVQKLIAPFLPPQISSSNTSHTNLASLEHIQSTIPALF